MLVEEQKAVKLFLTTNPELLSLDLSEAKHGSGIGQFIKKLTKLKHLSLSGWQVTSDDLRSFKGLKELTSLVLKSTRINDECVKILHGKLEDLIFITVEEFETLNTLDISSCHMIKDVTLLRGSHGTMKYLRIRNEKFGFTELIWPQVN
jgi:hypothetical protein